MTELDLFSPGIPKTVGKAIQMRGGPIVRDSSTISPVDLGLYTWVGLVSVHCRNFFVGLIVLIYSRTIVIPPKIASFTKLPVILAADISG